MPNYSFEEYKKSYTGNANNTQEIQKIAMEVSQSLKKLYNNIIKTGKNIDVASTISKASSGVLGFVEDPTTIEFEDSNDAEKNSQKKWQKSADDFMAFFDLSYEDSMKLAGDNVFDEPEKVDVKKLNEQFAFLSKTFGFVNNNFFMPNSNNKLDDNIINTNNISDPVQADTIHRDMPKISDEERKLRDEYAATVSFEGNLRKFAKGLDAVHWYGAGGVSGDLQAVKDAIKDYFDYRKQADSPAYDHAEEERLVGEIARTANEYIAAKRREGVRNFTGKPNEPQWRPWSDMGKTRFESAMDIETLANSRKAVLKAANDEIRSINLNIIDNEPIIKDDSKSELNIDNNIIINEEKADEKENEIKQEEPAKEENIIEQKVEEKDAENVNENENIILEENPVKEEQKAEEKAQEKAKEPEKKEEKKEPEKNIIIEENKNKINLPEENKAPYENESPEQKTKRIKKARLTFNGERFKVGKLTQILMNMYDYDKLDADSVNKQAASLIAAKELSEKFNEGIKYVNVSDRFEGRREKLTLDKNLYSYVFRLCKNPDKAKNLLLDPDALTKDYADYYKLVVEKNEAFDKYGEHSAGGYIAKAKFDIAVGEDGNTEPYSYLIVAQAMSKKTGLNSSLPADEYSKLHS